MRLKVRRNPLASTDALICADVDLGGLALPDGSRPVIKSIDVHQEDGLWVAVVKLEVIPDIDCTALGEDGALPVSVVADDVVARTARVHVGGEEVPTDSFRFAIGADGTMVRRVEYAHA